MHGTNYLIQQQKSVASQKNRVLLEKKHAETEHLIAANYYKKEEKE